MKAFIAVCPASAERFAFSYEEEEEEVGCVGVRSLIEPPSRLNFRPGASSGNRRHQQDGRRHSAGRPL